MKPNLHQAKSEATRERLLSAALAVMQARGAGALSIQAVAQEAGMSSGAVQYHFASKAVLMMQVLGRLIDALEGAVDFWPSPRWGLRRRAEQFVQQAWEQLYGQPRFASAWSAYLAARDDALVKAHIMEQRAQFHERLKAQFLAAFPEVRPLPDADARVQFVFSVLRGLGLIAPFASERTIASQLAVLSAYIQSMNTQETT